MNQQEFKQLADLLFPNELPTPAALEEKYSARNLPEGARVTRYAPSPTGFMHLGNLFSAFISERTAHTTNGIFYVRIEDTDKKREVEGGVTAILSDLESFGFTVDEGAAGETEEKGDYGPYRQSHRKELYHVYAKELTLAGYAYPCFCTADELSALREKQETEKLTPGYYGEFAACRNLSLDEIQKRLSEGKPYVLRLRSPGTQEGKAIFDDMIKGKIEMPENNQDIVLLKSDGIPTYHFAHAVDDHLMRTTHVVRGDEWIASAPIHLQLFKLLGFKPPKYAHIAPLMKEENGGKRKLSKRKDPEAAVSYYFEQGYPAASVREYLLTLANSNYEEWRRANGDAPQESFPFNLKKMSSSGALVDLVKFNDVSKNVISRMDGQTVADSVTKWAEKYQADFHAKLARDPAFTVGIFSIDRGGAKPRKDLACWKDAIDYTEYFFEKPTQYELPENIVPADAALVLGEYLKTYHHQVDKDGWFAGLKEICPALGYSPDVKAYKKDPDSFKGHVGDVSTMVRLAITGRRNTPDLYAIMQLLGEEECKQRMENAIAFFEK